MYRETFEVQKRVLGVEHPDTLTLSNNLANMVGRLETWRSPYGLGRFGIRANTIAPGLGDTPLSRVEVLIDERPSTSWTASGTAALCLQDGSTLP